MAKYRKKPIIIEAIQWFKNDKNDCVVKPYKDINNNNIKCKECNNIMKDHGWIDTKEGRYIVCPGDFIITGIKGEKYPCKPDIFYLTYELIEE